LGIAEVGILQAGCLSCHPGNIINFLWFVCAK